MGQHKSPELLRRLARVEGHVRAIRSMITEGRSYPEVAQQISAVRSALDGAFQLIVADLAEHCSVDTKSSSTLRSTVDDLRAVVALAR
jgi:DNA-binding FrmR family transcriptional regulator